MVDLEVIIDFAHKHYDAANCHYDGENYYKHITMVTDVLRVNRRIFVSFDDFEHTLGAAQTHDLIEDAKVTYNNILDVCGKEVADITLAVTDVPAENRLLRHLLTMPKTVKDHRAIILKMCDMGANAGYSYLHRSSMYEKYVEEYQYRKPIFTKALTWYRDKINQEELDKLWIQLDNIHNKLIK